VFVSINKAQAKQSKLKGKSLMSNWQDVLIDQLDHLHVYINLCMLLNYFPLLRKDELTLTIISIELIIRTSNMYNHI